MSREEIEGRVRNEIQREISHETWRGLRIGSYRYKVPIPSELQGSKWAWGYCSHWSTHEGAEPLVSLFDVAQAIAAVRAEAAPSSPGDGWVMVPIVPRDEMVRAGDAVLAQSTWPDADDIWTAMIDARPLPTEGEGTNG